MHAVTQLLRSLGPMRLAIVGGVVLAVAAFFTIVLTQLSETDLALLYGDLDMQDSGAIVEQLEAQGTPFELRSNGTAIYVPEDMVAPLRVKLADQGIPAGGSVGYELFDKSDALGTTNFMQNVNLVRALEGELARTIRSIDTVQAARVHLVLPKRELFSRQQQEPSASIVLKMRGNKRLALSQVVALQNLVASAVPGLLPARISVIDDQGTLLAGGFEGEDAIADLDAKAEERRARFENRMAGAVEELLAKTVGPGNVRVRVFADMDFDRINTSEEIYDPDGQVVRSTQSIEEAAQNSEGSGPPPVSVANNLPDADPLAEDGATASSQENRVEETINYEISKKIVNHVREAGVINRLSVAVLVDGTYGTAEDGTATYTPRPQEELDLLATLVRGAIGFDAERGDSVEVINMPFAEQEAAPIAEDVQLLFGLDRSDLVALAQYLVLLIFGLLVILLVVRPLLNRVLESMPAPASLGPSNELLERGPETPALTGPAGASASGQAGGGLPVAVTKGGVPAHADDLEEMIDLDRVEGRVRASSVRQVGELVDKHPEEAIAIIRKWLHEDY